MKKESPAPEDYIIEREFLGKITVTEFISRVIQSHLQENGRTEPEKREVENT